MSAREEMAGSLQLFEDELGNFVSATSELGNFVSATSDFLRGEMTAIDEKGFWIVLPYAQVRDLPRLLLSPIGVVPQRGWRPRTIVDYQLYDANAETARMASREATQLGYAPKPVLYKLRFSEPKHGPI
jgi:hypothetical protein